METNETATSSTEQKHHHHHSHSSSSSSEHHHHSSRRRRKKIMRQRAILLGCTTVAFLFILVFIYAIMRDVIEIWPLLFKALPVACLGGIVVGFCYYLFAQWQYKKERQS